MKKALIGLALLGVSLGLAAGVYAATSANVYIHVTVVSGSVSLVRDGAQDVYLNQVVVGSTTLTSYTAFHNDGDTQSNWSLSNTISGQGAAWTFVTATGAGTAIPAINQVRFSGIWRSNATPPAGASKFPLVAGDYTINDVISPTPVQSDATHFAVAGDVATVKGYNVNPAAAADHYLYFRFDTPLTGSTNIGTASGETVITVTVTASSSL
jgi:hypothetical protein